MFLKNFVNAVVNAESTAVKVVGYTTLAAIGIGADIIGASAKKVETKVAEAPATATEEVHDEDILTEVVHDDDVVVEVVHENEEYDDSADREAEDKLFEAAIKSTSNSFELACDEVIELRKN